MSNNITVRDSGNAVQTIKTTETGSVHVTHHNIDSSALPSGAATETTLSTIKVNVANTNTKATAIYTAAANTASQASALNTKATAIYTATSNTSTQVAALGTSYLNSIKTTSANTLTMQTAIKVNVANTNTILTAVKVATANTRTMATAVYTATANTAAQVKRSTLVTSARVTLANTTTLIAGARSGRNSITVVNHGTTVIYLGGPGVAVANGMFVSGTAGSTVVLKTAAAIYGIATTGTQIISVLEAY